MPDMGSLSKQHENIKMADPAAVSISGTGTQGQGTWGLGDVGTWRLGDSGTRIFTICLTFHHISQNPRLLIVIALYPGFKFLVCTM